MRANSKISGAVGAIVGANSMLFIGNWVPSSSLMRVLLCGVIGGVTALLLEKVLKSKSDSSSGT